MGMSSGGGDGELNAEINVTPLVDVMLVLLIIFMITAPMMNTGVDIELPKVTATEQVASTTDKIILSLDATGHVFLTAPNSKGTPIAWVDLEKTLAGVKANGGAIEKGLYVNADGKLKYSIVITAMAVARKAGIEKVMMVTTPTATLPLADLDKGVSP